MYPLETPKPGTEARWSLDFGTPSPNSLTSPSDRSSRDLIGRDRDTVRAHPGRLGMRRSNERCTRRARVRIGAGLACVALAVVTVSEPATASPTTAPTVVTSMMDTNAGVRVRWSFQTDAIQRDRTVEIARSVAGGAFVVIHTKPNAPRKATYLDKTPPTQSTSYRARAIVSGVTTAWGPSSVVNIVASPTTTTSTTTSPGGGSDNLPVPPSGQTVCESGAEQYVLDQVNAERASAGRPALRRDVRLARAARQRAIDIAQNGASHAGWDTTIRSFGYNASWLAENIAWGYSTQSVVSVGWMTSSGHRANMLAAGADDAGVGCVIRGNTKWWALDLGG